MEDSVSISDIETKENVSSAETKEKISIAVAKEKVSSAAAKGGKAFMSLVHMAKLSPKESKPSGSPKNFDGDSDEPTTNSPKSSMERTAKTVSDEPPLNSPKTNSERKEKLVSDELPPTSPKSSIERKAKHVSDEPSPNSPNSSLERKEKLLSDEPTPNSPKSSMERKAKLVNKLKRGFKVGKKSTDADNRSQLLDGNADDPSPRVRSADSIKIAYGHKPSTDPASIAAMNREKLIERQEKLQAMNNQSEEMLEGAGNFASMAEELAKKIENKKWYQL